LPHPRKPPAGALTAVLLGLTRTAHRFSSETQFHLIDPICVHRSFLLTYLTEGTWTKAVHVKGFLENVDCV
jgi:hypothetical protein